jgi:hypothetical protein
MSTPANRNVDKLATKAQQASTTRHSTLITIGKIRSDEEFMIRFPEAAKLTNYFHKVITNSGRYHAGKALTETRKTAFDITSSGVIDIALIKECIRFCFSEEIKEISFWYQVPFNHLGTVMKFFNTWLDIKRNTKSKTDRKQICNKANKKGIKI